MKNYYSITLAVFCLFFVSIDSKAQTKAEFGLKGGILFSNIHAIDNNSNFEFEKKDGLTLGMFYKKSDLLGPLGFQTELLYQMKGANVFMEHYDILPDQGQGSNIELTGAYYRDKEQLHYLTIPLLLTVRTAKFLDFYAGPEFGYLLSYKSKRQETGEMNRFSVGVAVGATLKICEKTHLDFRFSSDFTSYDKLNKYNSTELKNYGFGITIHQTLTRKPTK